MDSSFLGGLQPQLWDCSSLWDRWSQASLTGPKQSCTIVLPLQHLCYICQGLTTEILYLPQVPPMNPQLEPHLLALTSQSRVCVERTDGGAPLPSTPFLLSSIQSWAP